MANGMSDKDFDDFIKLMADIYIGINIDDSDVIVRGLHYEEIKQQLLGDSL